MPNGAQMSRQRTRVRVQRKQRWWRRRGIRRALIGLGLLAIFALIDSGWAATNVARDLKMARDQLQLGADALVRGDLADARTRFELAQRAAQGAANFKMHPTVALASILPGTSDDVEAVEALAASGLKAAQAGGSLVGAAEAVGWDGSGLPGGSPGSVVAPKLLRAAAPQLADASKRLSEANDLLAPVQTGGLFGPIRDAVITARGTLEGQARLVSSAGTLAELLPSLTGGDGPRRYFVGIQNLDAPRGTGGFLGFYSILTASDGHLSLGEFHKADDFPEVKPVHVPHVVAERYTRFGTRRLLFAANYSPDMPTTSRIILEMWKAADKAPLDGVIMVDTVWFKYLLEAIGPVDTAVWPEPITSKNVIQILNEETFKLPVGESDPLQATLGAQIWDAILNRSPSPSAFATALSRSVAERHIQVYATRPDEETLLRRLGATGEADLGKNPLYVVWQDYTNTGKAGYFAERSIDQSVTLRPDGTAEVTSTVHMANHSPTKPPSELIGSGELPGEPPGYWAALVNIYLPKEIQGSPTFSYSEGGSIEIVEHEFGRPVVMGLLHALAGESFTYAATYAAPAAAVPSGDGFEYTLDVQPQPSLSPIPLTIRIQLPDGAHVLSASAAFEVNGATLSYDQSPTTPQSLRVTYSLG